MSLRLRLLSWFSATAVLTLMVVMVLVDGAFRRQIQSDLEDNLVFARQVATGAWSAAVGDQVEASAAFALDPRLRAAVSTEDRATIEQTLREVFQDAPQAWAAVLSPAGALLAATSAAPPVALAADDPLLAEARFFDTADLRARAGGLELLAVSAVLFGAEPLAILVTGHRLGPADVSALEAAVGRPVLLVGPTTTFAGPEARDTGFEPDGIDARDPNPSVRLVESSGERYLAAPAPLESSTQGRLGALVVLHSLDAALAPADTLRAWLLVILVLGLLLTLGVGALFSRGITVPIARLLIDTERLASGDLERPIVPLRDVLFMSSFFSQSHIQNPVCQHR